MEITNKTISELNPGARVKRVDTFSIGDDDYDSVTYDDGCVISWKRVVNSAKENLSMEYSEKIKL